MDKKTILLMSIMIVILFSSQVFAYETKGQIPAQAQVLKDDIYDLKIVSVKAIKHDVPINQNNKNYCGEIEIITNLRSESGSRALGILVSLPLDDKSKYPKYINELYKSKKYTGTSVMLSKENGNTFLYSPENKVNTFNILIYDNKLCDAEFLDVYVFKPYHVGLGTQNNVLVYTKEGYEGQSTYDVKNYGYDLEKYANSLYNINNENNKFNTHINSSFIILEESYYYNVDYAYGVPVSKSNEDVENKYKKTFFQNIIQNNNPNVEKDEKKSEETSTPKEETAIIEQNNLKINKIINTTTNEELIYDTENDRYYFASDTVNLDVYLDPDFNKNKEICYLYTDLSNLNQDQINSFLEKYTKEETVIGLQNVSCTNIDSGKISLNNISQNKFLLILQRKDPTNLLISKTRIVKVSKESYLNYIRFEINKKIANFFCPTCNYPKFNFNLAGDLEITIPEINIETEQTIPETNNTNQEEQTEASTNNCAITKQGTLEEYINCLKNNIEIIDLTKSYALVVNGEIIGSPILGDTLINQKYSLSNSNACYTREGFNEKIFEVAKNLNLTEEETAQFWSKIAAESGCNLVVRDGELCGSQGLAQINASVWNNSNSYNTIKPYLLEINADKYNTFTKFSTILGNIRLDHTSSLEISIAINRYNNSEIFNKSRNAQRPLLETMEKNYDNDDAIDLFFANSYVYGGGISYANHFTNGIVNTDSRYQGVAYTALHKMGYYLAYKRMIYECSKEDLSNNFVNAYKNIYNGKYCK